MVSSLARAVESLLAERAGGAARIASTRAVGGGCINEAAIVRLEDGREFFVKWNAAPLPHMFEREAEGLEALRAAGAIRVPRVIGFGGSGGGVGGGTEGDGGSGGGVPPFLVLEAIAQRRKPRGFAEDFGRRLAALHRESGEPRHGLVNDAGGPASNAPSWSAPVSGFGFPHDNYIGSTPQPNGWCVGWVEFWRTRRLGFQLDLARRNGRATPELNRLGDRLLARLDDLIAEPAESPCLLHGDLWGGNYLVDEAGAPVFIDPAAYYGRREADLAMTMLFGGFDSGFYAAYNKAWPLAAGSERRIEVYKLYHLLNHLNLFGGSYLASCLSVIRRLI